MEIHASTRYVRMSPRKVRLVAGLIRNMDAIPALDQLRFTVKAARGPIEKTLRSALANAEHNFHIEKEDLKIKKIFVDKGSVLKRWRARAFGRAAPIKKHICHITIILDTKEKEKETPASSSNKELKQEQKKKKARAPKKA